MALSGSIATGKTTVSEIMKKEGVVIIDTDQITHSLYQIPGELFRELAIVFGQEIISEKGIDRQKLAAIVFNNPEKLSKLNEIVHPAVKKEVYRLLENLQQEEKNKNKNYLVILVIPLLFEVNSSYNSEFIIVAACSPENQLKRLCQRNSISYEEAKKRIISQLPIEIKSKKADYVIDTNGNFSEIELQVKELLKKWRWDSYE